MCEHTRQVLTESNLQAIRDDYSQIFTKLGTASKEDGEEKIVEAYNEDRLNTGAQLNTPVCKHAWPCTSPLHIIPPMPTSSHKSAPMYMPTPHPGSTAHGQHVYDL